MTTPCPLLPLSRSRALSRAAKVLSGNLVAVSDNAAALVRQAYDAYHKNEKDAKTFDALLREPFLLSDEARVRHFCERPPLP